MTDRKLLEKAAKAAGMTHLTQWSDAITDHDSPHYREPALHPGGFGEECCSWNPLINDGDAFRLAVNLTMSIEFNGDDCDACPTNGDWVTEPHGDDPYAATRRAITRAAASMATQEKAE